MNNWKLGVLLVAVNLICMVVLTSRAERLLDSLADNQSKQLEHEIMFLELYREQTANTFKLTACAIDRSQCDALQGETVKDNIMQSNDEQVGIWSEGRRGHVDSSGNGGVPLRPPYSEYLMR